jgi:hypothetical protein
MCPFSLEPVYYIYMQRIIETFVKSTRENEFYRILVQDDAYGTGNYIVKVFETDENGASKHWNAILEEEVRARTNIAKLSKALDRAAQLTKEYATGAR